MSIQELYQQAIKPMAAAQRLELAAMILSDIPPQSVVDYQTEWSDEDLADLSRTTWNRIGPGARLRWLSRETWGSPDVRIIGHLSDRDWRGVVNALRGAFG